MFFDPANTGLLLLGASEFQEDPEDNNRAVFKNAYDEVLKYFKNVRLGPGLSNRNIFHGFDKDQGKDELIGDMERFLRNNHFNDLFVYICSHGLQDGSFFGFQLPRSDTKDPDTFVRFERLRSQITEITKARVYFIVDVCYSGMVHEDLDIPEISPEAFQYITGIRGDMLPEGGICMITCNSRNHIGRTIADDGRSDISLPLFTHELLDVLRNGVENHSKYGLSIDHLQSILDERVKKRLLEFGDWDGSSPRADAVDFSDIPRLEPGKVGLLSRLFLFQNNHVSKDLVNEAARRFRGFYSRLERKDELLSKRDQQIEQLNAKLSTADDSISKLRRKNQRAFAANTIFVALSLILLCVLGALYYSEEIIALLSNIR